MRVLMRIVPFYLKFQIILCNIVLAFLLALNFNKAAFAQNIGQWSIDNSSQNKKSPMLLSANTLVYDRDASTIAAEGQVQIEYDGIRIVAKKVIYYQKTGRVKAEGDVEVVQPDGTKTYAQSIDMTKDFADGFVNALHVETTDNIRFAAENAVRSGGQMTVFNNGAYTACEPCYYKPDREILWQIKAKKLIWNGATKTMRFEDSHMEFFGIPIAWFPVFEMPDPTVKRRSGFLTPRFAYDSDLGISVKNSYFWNLAPNYDFTLSPTAYTNQGLMLEGEWRQRMEAGNINLRFAYIYQFKPDAFSTNTIDRLNTNRFMLASRGSFNINSNWNYGWNVIAQSDHNFSRTYEIAGYSDSLIRDQIYLKGLAERNYFDLSFYHFQVQESMLDTDSSARYAKQPWVLPHLDYEYIPDDSVYGGQLKFLTNLQALYREKQDFAFADWQGNSLNQARLAGIAGTSVRLTTEMEWKKTFTTQSGLVFTPLMALRSDLITTSPEGDNDIYDANSGYQAYDIKDNAFRGIMTAGLEVRYPLLITLGNSTHIVEPIAQVFARNNEKYTNRLPNEDSQSLVFDTTTLFERDKFSGYDRVEGGTRANFGVRYSGTLSDDFSIYALAGQSYQLAGKNSYAADDLVSVGADSGLETKLSDYVAMLGIGSNDGLTVATRGRFDEETMAIRRGEFEISQNWDKVFASATYNYIESQPDYGYKEDRKDISATTRLKFTDNWSLGALGTYDLVSNTLTEAGGYLNYLDECFGLYLSYKQNRSPLNQELSHSFGFIVSLRTIADFGQSVQQGTQTSSFLNK